MKTYRYHRVKPHQHVIVAVVWIALMAWVWPSPTLMLFLSGLVAVGLFEYQKRLRIVIEIDESSLRYRDEATSFVLLASESVTLAPTSGESGLQTDVYLVSEKGRVRVSEHYENFEDLFRDVNRLWPNLPNLSTVSVS